MILPQEQKIIIRGVEYTLTKLELPLHNELREWARKRLPDPFEGLAERVKGLPLELQKYMLDKAWQAAQDRKREDSEEVNSEIGTADGMAYLFHLLLRKNHPGVTPEQAGAIILSGVEEHGPDLFNKVFSRAYGVDDPDPLAVNREFFGEDDGKKKPRRR